MPKTKKKKPKPYRLIALIAALVLTLPACESFRLSSEQRRTISSSIEDQYQQGTITKAERDIALEKLNAPDGGFDLENLLWALGSIAGSLFGVRIYRGAPTQKVGLPAAKVLPSESSTG